MLSLELIRSGTNRLRTRLNKKGSIKHPLVEVPAPCMNCGHSTASLILTPLYFDFNPRLIPSHLRDVFINRLDGICANCGLYQDYERFSFEQMKEFLEFNKDETVSEGAFHEYPFPESFINLFDAQHTLQRIKRWDMILPNSADAVRKCLFLRPMFGGTLRYVAEKYGPEIHAMEISAACRRHLKDNHPGTLFPNGQIHGLFELSETGTYDAIFVFHSLIHSIDVHAYVEALRGRLSEQGFIVFSQETQSKPQNPFHFLFPTEYQLLRILDKHFTSIVRIDDCEPDPPPSITTMTIKGDSPDFVCRP